jgi:3-oxoacyl-[acyl-carrier protein] reductase
VTAVVIGSGGIGAEVVRDLRRRGREVAVGWHSSAAVATELSVPGFQVDVTDLASCRELFAAVGRRLGPVTAVVNCFGAVEEAPLLRVAPHDVHRLIDLNLTGVVNVCRAAAFRMMKAGGGSIVTIGSAASVMGVPGLSVYSATKAALAGFGRSLAAELAPFRITCNTVLPGFIDCGATAASAPSRKKVLERHIPLKRLGTPAEVAALVAYLISPDSRYVTGQQFVIDGGWTLGTAALAHDLSEEALQENALDGARHG